MFLLIYYNFFFLLWTSFWIFWNGSSWFFDFLSGFIFWDSILLFHVCYFMWLLIIFMFLGLYELLRNEANVGFLGLIVYFEGCSVHFSFHSKLLSIKIFHQSNWLRRLYCIKNWTLCTWIARICLKFEKIQFFNSMNQVLLIGLGFKVIK